MTDWSARNARTPSSSRPPPTYLEQQLGWESVYAHNQEDFGPESLLGREVVLVRPLCERPKMAPKRPKILY